MKKNNPGYIISLLGTKRTITLKFVKEGPLVVVKEGPLVVVKEGPLDVVKEGPLVTEFDYVLLLVFKIIIILSNLLCISSLYLHSQLFEYMICLYLIDVLHC